MKFIYQFKDFFLDHFLLIEGFALSLSLLYRDPTCLPLNVSYRNTQEHSSISYPDKRKKLLAGVIVGAVEQERNKPITVRRSFRYE